MATRWTLTSWFVLGACTNNPPPSARAPAPTVAAQFAVAVDAPAVAMDAGAPARCVAPTWRGRAQHVAVDEGGGGALVVFLCVDRAEQECVHYEASPGNTAATPVEYARGSSQRSRFTGRPGRSRYELLRGEGPARVCGDDHASCVDTILPHVEGLDSAAVTDDGRYIVYQPTAVTAVAVFPVAPGDERRIVMNLAWVDATLLGTALVATFCDDYVSRFECRAEVRALPSGRRVATVARHGADVHAVVRVADDRWAVVDAAAGTWVTLRGDGSVVGSTRTVVDAAAVRAGRALLYPRPEGGYALIVRDPGDADFGAVRWFTWEGTAAESTTRVPWCSSRQG
jgi:hypothetical protein